MSESVIQIVIKTVHNDLHNLSVDRSTTVIDLKSRIHDVTSISVDRQRLIYRGRVLQDESSVRDYNIEDGHTVHMVARPVNYQELQQNAELANPTVNSVPNPSTLRTGTSQQTRLISSTGATLAIGPADESNTMEHIRQNILTLHTLLSTVSSADISGVVGNISTSHVHHMSGESGPVESPSSAPDESTVNRRFFVGQWVDVRDTVHQWLEATVMDTNETERRLFVHYNGWPDRWDEWLPFDSPRIAPFRSRTVHSTLTPYLSPTPNVSLARAPITGANDLRTLLPEIARMFRVLQPIIENAAALAEQSLQDRPTVSAYVPSAAARNDPITPSASQSESSHSAGAPDTSAAVPSAVAGAVASVRPQVASSVTSPNSGAAAVRIAPSMPWENVGQRQPAAVGASQSMSRVPSSSPLQQQQRVSRMETSANSSVTSSDRRQRLRYANYDSAQELTPRESPDPFSCLPLDSPSASRASWDSFARGRASANLSPRNANSESFISRKRSADCAENEADDSSHYMRDSQPVENATKVDSEHTCKMSGDDGGENEKASSPAATTEPAAGNEEIVTEERRAARAAETDSRLRHLAQELCPMIDRFGRVLTDIAPHLWELGAMDVDPAPGANPRVSSTAGSRSAQETNNDLAFEASLLALLRERPPSPQARRAYRTPIALQTRIGGVGGPASQANNALGFGAAMSVLGDLSFLTGGASVPQTGPGSAAGGGSSAGNRQMDIHIAFLPQVSGMAGNASATAAHERAAALSNTILQAQMAQNLSARTQLLSSRTQELNNYSVALEDMLRALNSLPGDRNASASATNNASGPPTTRSRTSRTGSEDNVMRGPMPVGAARTRTASASASSASSSAFSSATGSHANSNNGNRVFSSSILPGSLRTVPRPTAFLVTPAGLQAVGILPTNIASSSAPSVPAASSRANWNPPAAASHTSAANHHNPSAAPSTNATTGSSASISATNLNPSAAEEDYSMNMEVQEQREGEPGEYSDSSLSLLAAHQQIIGMSGQMEEGDEEEEEEEESAPLDDLLPTLSFNELGQSLMDVRAARAHLNQEAEHENDDDSQEDVCNVGVDASEAGGTSVGVAEASARSTDGDPTATTTGSGASEASVLVPPASAPSVYDRIRRSFNF